MSRRGRSRADPRNRPHTRPPRTALSAGPGRARAACSSECFHGRGAATGGSHWSLNTSPTSHDLWKQWRGANQHLISDKGSGAARRPGPSTRGRHGSATHTPGPRTLCGALRTCRAHSSQGHQRGRGRDSSVCGSAPHGRPLPLETRPRARLPWRLAPTRSGARAALVSLPRVPNTQSEVR